MPRLLRDRYYEYAPNRAWDLVTGDVMSPSAEESAGEVSSPASQALIELLENGTEGAPRWIVTATGDWRTYLRATAGEARRRGYVPMGVEIFFRTRALLASELATRAIVLIARPDTSEERLTVALLHAAAISPGPHLLVVPAKSRSHRGAVRWRAAEARAAYGGARLRPVAPVAPTDVVRLLEKARHAPDLVRAGRHAAAERLLREIAAALSRRRALHAAADTYISLGRLLLERGSATAADAAFSEAAAHAESVDLRLVFAARIWQAAARTDAGQLTAAESLCRAVLVAAPPDEPHRAWAEATLARVLLWQERSDEACALQRPHDAASAFIEATAVRLLVERGDLFEAGGRVRALLDRWSQASDVNRVIALAAHVRVLLAAGDLTIAQERLRDLASATRAARTPLRLVRMRLLWAEALRRAGRTTEADRELRTLSRMRAALPPLLRTAIDRSVKHPHPVVKSIGVYRPGASGSAAALVALAQREGDDREAVSRIGDFVLNALRSTRAEFWTCHAGPATAVVVCGGGLPSHLGARALEAGIALGPEQVESGWEMAAPVRLGSDAVGALVVRWPADRTVPGDASSLLELAAAVAAPRLEAMHQTSRRVAHAATAIPELVGVSESIAEVRRAVVRAATAPFSILIEGESGVGKELVARAVHQLSPRRERRFCDVNCAALPDDLFESELFGHARGAFTGAVTDRAGLVEDADGGTLFLDEVADLSARAQAKLLRVVQQQEVRRVGETFSRKVDVRFVSAANRDLRHEAEQGRFRQDLLYRLDVIRVRIPPLRERPEDITPLACHFWEAAAARVTTRATLSHGVLTSLARYHWPGNVRELQNVMAALAVEAPSRGQVRATLLPAIITGTSTVRSGRLSEARLQWERRFVEVAIARAGGNRTRAARDLGLTRQGLLKVLARLGLGSG
jgi:DNA-binding NtrC family response regulator/tetratricopeptide (TPR) repeat protein